MSAGTERTRRGFKNEENRKRAKNSNVVTMEGNKLRKTEEKTVEKSQNRCRREIKNGERGTSFLFLINVDDSTSSTHNHKERGQKPNFFVPAKNIIEKLQTKNATTQ